MEAEVAGVREEGNISPCWGRVNITMYTKFKNWLGAPNIQDFETENLFQFLNNNCS